LGGIFNYDRVKAVVTEAGYKLINVVFGEKSRNARIWVECPEKHEYETSWPSFQNGNRCYKCGVKEAGKKKRRPTEEVYLIYQNYGYKVLTPISEYNATYKPIEIQCTNGHIRKVTLTHFSKTPECPQCKGHRYKYTYEEVLSAFQDRNCVLLSTEYISNKVPLDYICPNGHFASVHFYDFRNGVQCSKCTGCRKYTLEEVRQFFEKENCVLLESIYINNHTKMNYQCSCGNESKIDLSNFLYGVRCMECYLESKKGENAPNWNPNITEEERTIKRKFYGYKEWRLSVFERDKFSCQCCGDNKGGNLNAHHLDGYDWCIEKRLDVENGITLCEGCHTDFHKKYGFGGNTIEQFDEYMSDNVISRSLLRSYKS
jgi:hypothetical protein